ncbi:MAG TPA: F0F1 ATP synthase subunit A [Bacillales bacterium]|nr:F0F1 ATP synthase subunit A [Bacillales bacterium]
MEITPKIHFLGMTFDLTVMIGTVVTMIIVLLLILPATRGKKMRPRGIQNVMEMVLEFVQGVTKIMMEDRQAEKYLSFALTTFLFVFIANQLGVIVMVGAEATGAIPSLGLTHEALQQADSVNWFKSPTSDINVTVALAFGIAIYAHFAGLFKSPKGYLKDYVHPYPALLPLHLIDEIAKPTTHAARLWANIFAGEVLILILREGFEHFYVTGIPLIVWIGFSIFVSTIQAYIFTVLAMVYISQKVADGGH